MANALERVVEDCLLEMMNERAEDSRICILFQDFNLDKRTIEHSIAAICRGSFLSTKRKTRKRRNLYIHSNWLNNFNLKYFETKVKKIQRKEGYFRVRKKFTLDDLDVLIAEIEAVTNDLEELHEIIFGSGWARNELTSL